MHSSAIMRKVVLLMALLLLASCSSGKGNVKAAKDRKDERGIKSEPTVSSNVSAKKSSKAPKSTPKQKGEAPLYNGVTYFGPAKD